MLPMIDSGLVGGIVRRSLDDCSRGLGSSTRREQFVEPVVERFDEGCSRT
jgi:hypothetical protein